MILFEKMLTCSRSYTSPDSFEEMKAQARRLVEAMDTSRDRIAVMTFSSPPPGKRKPAAHGRANLKVLNSSGSVAKKQLIDNIVTLQPGLQADPAGRDVNAAVNAAVKTLHEMPMDTGKYGSKRTGHLFLLTSNLDDAIIGGNFGGVNIHILGVGPVFAPVSTMGADGWCSSLSSSEMGHGLKKIVANDVEYDVEKPVPKTGTDVKEIVGILRMGIDVGVIESGELVFTAGEGCRIKGVMGETTFGALLPGERRNVMVKIEVGNLPEWDEPDDYDNTTLDLDFDHVDRELQATLGELKSTMLTVQAVYHHSVLSSTPSTTITTTVSVDALRYLEGSLWSGSQKSLQGSTAPMRFHDNGEQSRKSFVKAVLIQNLATRHRSAREARHAVEQLRDEVASPLVIRELGHQVWLEGRFGTRQFGDSPRNDGAYTTPMEVFERRFSLENPINRSQDDATPKPRGTNNISMASPHSPRRAKSEFDSLRAHSDSELYTPPPTGKYRHLHQVDRDSPDEAKKLWLRLGSGYDMEDNLKTLRMRGFSYPSDSEEEEEMERRRNSAGQETLVTLRDVRETDFSPWVL
jgi:hypothetical protein